MMRLGRTVDRSVARMIAYKRLVTGTMALVAGVVLAGFGLTAGHPVTPQLGFALLIFFGGGAWALRDGIRLRRELGR